MKQAMINYVQAEKNDILYTPPAAVRPLVKHLQDLINPPWVFIRTCPPTIWEPCDPGRSAISDVLREEGYTVMSSDIRTGTNFLTDPPPGEFDAIVTNPPYSLKDDFIEKCFSYGKPWAMLMPLTALEGKRRGDLFRRYGISLIVLDGRVNFMADKKSVWFNTSWFMWNSYRADPDSHLIFEKLEK